MRAVGLALMACAELAYAQVSPQAVELLQKIHHATLALSYRGVFVYQRGPHAETSRITRYVKGDEGVEKLEVLDGLPREVVRDRDSVKCYFPDRRMVKIDRRAGRRGFPALLPEELGRLEENYSINLGDVHRVAGFDAREVSLVPNDKFRYGYRLWSDVRSGMLLKAQIHDEDGRQLEQFMFTQLSLGGVTRSQVRPSKLPGGKWQVENSAGTPADFARDGWEFQPQVLGFRRIAELKRVLGKSRHVGQVVYSDGLAAVSVFVETANGKGRPHRAGAAGSGAVHLYARNLGDHVLTAVGEAPVVTVQRIADSVVYRGPQ